MARILVAEDDPNIFKLISFGVKRLGHEAVWAQDGAEAVAMAREERPDLIFLDVMMPVYDGFQVLEILKNDEETQDIPVIMLTAHRRDDDIAAGLERGASDYVIKPFSFADLVARMNAALARGGSAPE